MVARAAHCLSPHLRGTALSASISGNAGLDAARSRARHARSARLPSRERTSSVPSVGHCGGLGTNCRTILGQANAATIRRFPAGRCSHVRGAVAEMSHVRDKAPSPNAGGLDVGIIAGVGDVSLHAAVPCLRSALLIKPQGAAPVLVRARDGRKNRGRRPVARRRARAPRRAGDARRRP
jgi:hypothetical protein